MQIGITGLVREGGWGDIPDKLTVIASVSPRTVLAGTKLHGRQCWSPQANGPGRL